MGKTPVQSKFRPGARLRTRPRRPKGTMARPGICRWCRCWEFEPCPGGCGWANREQTLCTACVDVDREWKHIKASPLPNMTRAFFRGFLVGADDERAADLMGVIKPGNPYKPDAETARYWELGKAAGLKVAR